MNILVFGWAPLYGKLGGGARQHTADLCDFLSRRGDSVLYLRPESASAGIRGIKKDKRFGKTRECVWSLPSVLTPNSWQLSPNIFSNSFSEEIVEFVEREKIKLLIISSLEGFPVKSFLSIKERVSGLKIKVIVHDAFYFCPKVHLYKEYKRPCWDSNQGQDCESCVNFDRPFAPLRQMLKRSEWMKWAASAIKGLPETVSWRGEDYNSNIKKLLVTPAKPKTLLEEYKVLLRQFLALADEIICLSRFYAQLFELSFPDMKLPITVSRLSLPHLDGIRVGAEQSTFLPKYDLFFHGISNPSKGLDLFLKALSILKPAKTVHARILSDNQSKKLVKSFRYHQNIKVSLQRTFDSSDVKQNVLNSRIAVSASRLLENSSLVLLEGLSSGAYVIAPEQGGNAELLVGEHTLSFVANDPEDLAKKMNQLLDLPLTVEQRRSHLYKLRKTGVLAMSEEHLSQIVR